MPSFTMRRGDAIRLRHMLDAAREDIERDRQLLLAVVKDLEIIGEATSKVSADSVARWSRIPWQDIIGMRHRLIHGYFDVDVELVWNTVQNDLPPLAALLDEALSTAPE